MKKIVFNDNVFTIKDNSNDYLIREVNNFDNPSFILIDDNIQINVMKFYNSYKVNEDIKHYYNYENSANSKTINNRKIYSINQSNNITDYIIEIDDNKTLVLETSTTDNIDEILKLVTSSIQ